MLLFFSPHQTFENVSPGFLRSVKHSFIIIRGIASHSIMLENDLEISKKREREGTDECVHLFV
jgi:hypothetical protein